MRVVIAPDKFKGSLSAPDVARHLAAGLQAATGSNLDVLRIPVADGGEGTLTPPSAPASPAAAPPSAAPPAQRVRADFAVRGRERGHRNGRRVRPCRPAWRRSGQPDSAAARRHEPGHRRTDPGSARRRVPADHPRRRRERQHRRRRRRPPGPRRQAPRRRGSELPPGGGALARLDRIDFSGFDSRLDDTRFILASDVDNPLLGAEGAAAVFGPQKGATPADVAALDAALAHFVDVLAAEIGPRAPKAAAAPGAGAAGGVGYAAIAVLAADPPAGHRRRPGIHRAGGPAGRRGPGDHRRRQPGRTKPARQDPDGVARAAARAGVPVIAVCGRTTLTPEQQKTPDSGRSSR